MLATTLLCFVVGISDGDTLTARCGVRGNTNRSSEAAGHRRPWAQAAIRGACPAGTGRADFSERGRAALHQDRQAQAIGVLCLGCARISSDRAASTRCRIGHDHARHDLVVSRPCPRTVTAGARAVRVCWARSRAAQSGSLAWFAAISAMRLAQGLTQASTKPKSVNDRGCVETLGWPRFKN